MFKVTDITNVLKAESVTREEAPGMPIATYAPAWFDPASGAIEVRGARMTYEEALVEAAREGDHVYFAAIPDGPVMWLLSAIGASYGAILMAAVYKLGWAGVAAIGLGTTSTLLQVFGVFASDFGEPEEIEAGQAGFRGVQTTAGPGQVIPFILGKVKSGGHIIQTYTNPQYADAPATGDGITVVTQVERLAYSRHALHTLVSYGHGPVEAIEDIKIDGTDITDIRGAMYEVKYGDNIEAPPQLFDTDTTQTEVVVDSGVIDVAGGEKTGIETGDDCTRVGLKFGFPAGLYTTTANGQVQSREVEIDIRYREVGGSWGAKTTYKATGAARGYLPYWILLEVLGGEAEYEFGITRVTPDNTDPLIEDEFELDTMLIQTPGTHAFPGLVKIGFSQLSIELQAIPRNYTALISGRNTVRIYTDATTYTEGWTENPVWCLLHWLTHTELGPGKWYTYDDVIDMANWVDIADWCDELVPDGTGTGGSTTRATFGYEFIEPRTPPEVLQMFADTCGIWGIEEAGQWRLVADRPGPMVQVFGEGNYIADSFEMVWIGTGDKTSRLTGRYLNAATDYEVDLITVPFDDRAEGEHHVEQTVDMRGATSASQVTRRLTTMVRHAQMDNRAAVLKAGFSALELQAGDVYGVASRTGGIGIGNGRIRRTSWTYQELYLDDQVELDATKTYEITVCHARDGSVETDTLFVERSETTDIVRIKDPTAWVIRPEPGDQYAIGLAGRSIKKFRCITKRLKEDFTCDVIGVLYDPDVYDFEYICDEADTQYEYPTADRVPVPVENVAATARKTKDVSLGAYYYEIDVSWTVPSTAWPVSHYEIYHQLDASGSGWYEPTLTTGTTGTIVAHVRSAASVTYNIVVLPVTHTRRRHSIDQATQVSVTTPT